MDSLLLSIHVVAGILFVGPIAVATSLFTRYAPAGTTVHAHAITRVLGPTHGALYLAVAVTALLGRGLTARTRIGAVVPVLSGPLTMLNVRREARRA